MSFTKTSRVKVNGKDRILYQMQGSRVLYIKSKGAYVKFSDFKKTIKTNPKKRIGGAIYNEKDLRNTVKLNGKIYIADKEAPNKPLEDPISMSPIPIHKAILVNKRIYHINSIHKLMFPNNETDPNRYIPDPFTREDIGDYTRLVREKYNKIHGIPEPRNQLRYPLQRSKTIENFNKFGFRVKDRHLDMKNIPNHEYLL